MNRDLSHATFKILELGLEILAMARAAISTWLVVYYISGGNTIYTAFSVGVVEGALLLSLVMIKRSPVAPITAIIAIGFSAIMQYMELRVLDGTITPTEREMMRYAVAFSPIVLLTLAYVRRLFEDVDIPAALSKHMGNSLALPEREHVAELPAHNAQSVPARMKAGMNGDISDPN